MRQISQCIFFTLQFHNSDRYVFTSFGSESLKLFGLKSETVLEEASTFFDQLQEDDRLSLFSDLESSFKDKKQINQLIRFRGKDSIVNLNLHLNVLDKTDNSMIWNGVVIVNSENQDSLLTIHSKEQTELDLKERIKELDCLYGIAHLVEKEKITLGEILQGTADLLEKSWKNPAFVNTKLVYNGVKYSGANSISQCETCHYLERSNLFVYGKASGYVGMCSCDLNNGVVEIKNFTSNDHNLLNSIAERIGRVIERKSSEEALQKSEAKFRNYIESAPDGIFVIDNQGHYREVNEAACKLTEYSKKEILQMKMGSMTYKDDLQDIARNFKKCKEEGHSSGIFRYVTKSNKIKTWSVEGVKLSEERFLGFAKDITENQKMAEQIRHMEKMDVIGQLAGGIAHEFNNQIAVIMGYSEMLISQLEDPKLRRFAENILASSHRSDDLTRKLLSFAHKGLYENVPVNIHKVIGETIDILSHGIDKNIAISLNLKAEPPFTIGDPGQIQNILMNLAINARDAMPNGGEIVFETSIEYIDSEYCETLPYEVTEGAFILISVSDNGSGIDEKDVNRVFEPYYSTKEIDNGPSMGLSSVFDTVSRHHGVIEVNSTPGVGTSFLLYFPLSENTLVRGNKSTSYYLESGEASILLVDDDELVRQLGYDMLKNLGYGVKVCKDGTEAIDYYRDNWQSIDLVVLDMIMPGMGGKDVFRMIKEINSNILVILSSGFSLSGDVQQLLDEGANAFIGKPYEIGNLSEILKNVLKER